jgi:diguanylate cyclase (GGDEF)-like protein/PAS domain S-box-containing protein
MIMRSLSLMSDPSLELDGKLLLFNSMCDISKHNYAEYVLLESELRSRANIEQLPFGFSISHDGYTFDVNNVYLKMFGYNEIVEVCGQPVTNQIALKCRGQVNDLIRGRIQSDSKETLNETIGLRKDGSEFPLLVSTKRVVLSDITFTYAYLIDLTDRNKAEEEIEPFAFYDQLTNLPNRLFLIERLKQALTLSARLGRQGALLSIDLDDFKTLNQTLGHELGDQLLQKVGHRLKSCLREGDTLSRFGGDEFVMILENLSNRESESDEEIRAVCNRILDVLNHPYQLGDRKYRCTPSIGATLFNGNQQAIDDLMKQADIAMHQAKKGGRNTVRIFDPQMQVSINARAALQSELRKALDNQEFQLHFQMQVDNTGGPLGVEALIRWQHPERDMIFPEKFIPLAEETGLILPIGQWVLETACVQLKKWKSNEITRHLTISVNVSARQFRQIDFVSYVHAAVKRHNINPKLLKIELTEGMLLENIEETIATMKSLKETGVTFSLDDFGTGYSSLQYIKHLPLDQLKIDQSFIRDLATNSCDRAIVRTIVAMAQSLNLKIIAEGVETEEQRQILFNSGCTNYQGYLFCKPMPVEQFEKLLRNGKEHLMLGGQENG